MENISSGEIVRSHKGSDPPRFVTLEENTKEFPWVDTCKIRYLFQDESLEAGKDLLTLTNNPSQIPTNLEEVENEAVGDDLTRDYMENIWSIEDLLGRYEREILVWYHRLNYFYFKSIFRLSKRGG